MRRFMIVLSLFTVILLSGCGHINSITFTCPTGQLKVGDTLQLDYKIDSPKHSGYLTSEVSVEGIIEISSNDNGLIIQGIAPGYTELKLYDVNNKKTHDTCGISVIE
jgi:hypothetical protein